MSDVVKRLRSEIGDYYNNNSPWRAVPASEAREIVAHIDNIKALAGHRLDNWQWAARNVDRLTRIAEHRRQVLLGLEDCYNCSQRNNETYREILDMARRNWPEPFRCRNCAHWTSTPQLKPDGWCGEWHEPRETWNHYGCVNFTQAGKAKDEDSNGND